MRALCAAMVVLALAACRGGEERPTTKGTTSLRVYFVRGEHVGVSTRVVPRTSAVAAAAMRELLEGPDDDDRAGGLGTEIPADTELRSVALSNGTATVDLSAAFQSGGGSTSMALRVAQVVYTLTQFPTVRRVAFRLDGGPVEAIGGEGVIVTPPVGRAAFEAQTPAILVESLGPGDEVSSPLRVTGTANTFEATLHLQVVQGGRSLFDQFFTATSGSGTRGTFDASVTFEPDEDGPATGTLVAFERSAEDGSAINVVAIPVVLRR